MDLKKLLQKIDKNGQKYQGKVPTGDMNGAGEYKLTEGGTWVDGFYAGVYNIAYLLSGEEKFLDYSRAYEKLWDKRIINTGEVNERHGFMELDHDVGFIFLPACGFLAHNFADEKAREICIKAADVLADRFNEKGNFIKAWNTWRWDTNPEFIREKKGKVIIDSLMNLPLLFQAAQWTGEERYYNIGYKHAETVAKYIVREDWTTFHTYNFNPDTGAPIAGRTGQGYSDSSCWSRGQAWGVYGFALAYKYTKDEKFLEYSKGLAEYFMKHLSGTDIPCWDFAAADQTFAPWDSSAAAICASGLMELADLTDAKDAEYYVQQAKRLMSALDKWCSTEDYPRMEPILIHGCGGSAYREGYEKQIKSPAICQAFTFGDYYYMETLLKMSDCKIRIF